jgi:hypothetical protein
MLKLREISLEAAAAHVSLALTNGVNPEFPHRLVQGC